ncbi:MAG: polysaccharide deacetylase family protein [Clostridia bacterium]
MTYTSSNRNAKRRKKVRQRRIIAAITVIVILVVVIFTFAFVVKKIQTAQVMKIVGKEDVTVEVMTEYKDEGIATLLEKKDNLQSELVESNVDIKKPGKYTATYKITNKKGKNPITVVRTIDVVDKTAPKLSLKGGTIVTIKIGTAFKDAGATAIDNVDGDISANVVVSGEVKDKTIGEYKLTYASTDTSGNVSNIIRTVKVTQNESSTKYAPQDQTIHLTFDDGPSKITPQVLDVLKKYNVKATFFVVGKQLDDYPEYVKRIIDEGHAIALHTYTHEYSQIYSSVDNYMNDLQKVHDKVLEVTGVDTKIFRFPGGSDNTISRKYCPGVMTAADSLTREKGYLEYDWNMDSGDADGKKHTPEEMFQNLKNGLSSRKSDFYVLSHDEGSKKNTPATFDLFIDYAIKEGYKFDKITPDSPQWNLKIAN